MSNILRFVSKGSHVNKPHALIIIPQTVNFFNNVAGRRLSDALTELGWNVRVTTLADYDGQPADVAFLISIVELFHAIGDKSIAMRKIKQLHRKCPKLIMWLMEPTRTRWFDNSYVLFQECNLEILADNGLHNQVANLTPEQQQSYFHLFFGLTEIEKRQVRKVHAKRSERPIPWVFIGHKTKQRCQMAQRLVSSVDPAGLIYLTDVMPITETGPHLQDKSVQKILHRAKYHLWRAHHSSFYMEGERFRFSALTGSVPVKIVEEDEPESRVGLPFSYLMARPEELDQLLLPERFDSIRERFLEEYLRHPSLEDELGRLLGTTLQLARQPRALAA